MNKIGKSAIGSVETKKGWLASEFKKLEDQGYKKDGYVSEVDSHIFTKEVGGKRVFESVNVKLFGVDCPGFSI